MRGRQEPGEDRPVVMPFGQVTTGMRGPSPQQPKTRLQVLLDWPTRRATTTTPLTAASWAQPEQSQLDWTVHSGGTMDSSAEGYVKEFTRHSSDVLLNLDELRKRQILTDVCLLVDGRQLRAHKAVLMACSGFFYSVFLAQGAGEVSVLPLPEGIELRGFQVLLDFMYTSRLVLSVDSIRSVLAAAEYLRMDHVMDTCRRFIQTRDDHVGYCQTLAVAACSACHASTQDRAEAHLQMLEVQGAVPPPLKVGPPAAGSCQRGSVVRCPDSWTRSQAEWVEIQDLSGSFQKVLGPSSGAGENPARFQVESALSSPIQSEGGQERPQVRSIHPLEKEGPLRTGEGHKVHDRAPANGKPSVQIPNSPTRSGGHPNSPIESSTSRCHSALHNPDPKACNWKKYKFIVLNSLKQEEEGMQKELALALGKPEASHPFPQESQEGVTSGEEENTRRDVEVKEQPGLHLGFPNKLSPFCFVCGQSFQGVAQLRHHVLNSHPGEDLSNLAHHRTENGALTCGACDLRFPEEEQLQHHFLHIHNDEKPYKCSSCAAAFRYKGNLPSHRAAHSEEKPYRCSICSAQFNRPANLKTHSRIHSGEKPYKCETCGSRFVQVAHLRAHVLIHTGEKPYPCETCGTRFRHLQTLKSHIRIHTGEKPYHCERCDLHFRHKSQLRLHLRQKHGAITNTKIRYKVLSGPFATASY
ncbi:B-cell CLL/lymphoma 6 member B protein isoform X2 [Ambystoma mexicanum]|uniref:B-cell CLL/lymphoma 6 member B protein isoform X2 n=1 Tax=Ambystoma mexicanum TaxID=8296 RepID=UPI0037E7E77A